MKIELLSNSKNKDISISNEVFSKEFNESLVHQAVVSFMAAARQGSAKQKNRSEVRGGGKKPYRQKGCLLYTSPSPRDGLLSRMPSSA